MFTEQAYTTSDMPRQALSSIHVWIARIIAVMAPALRTVTGIDLTTAAVAMEMIIICAAAAIREPRA